MRNPIDLFTPIKIGPFELRNRIIMSPMTRLRADEACVPTEMMVRYYTERATAGLIITEGTHPSPLGRGYTYCPGLHNAEQAAGWRKVTDALHEAGGRIFVQLMHAGRVSHSSLLPGRALPVAPSAVRLSGLVHTFSGKVLFETPRALETEEIPQVVEEYRRSAELAVAAGFDGVEIHAATGYLPNQFLVTSSNRRTDAYGGPVEGRARFLLEVVEAVASVRGADRVGVKIAPGFTVNEMEDDDPSETFTHVARALAPFGLAYLHVGYDSGYSRGGSMPGLKPVDLIRAVYPGTLLAVGGFTRQSGQEAIASGRADAIVFGRPFIANPDLVERFARNAHLNLPDSANFYGGDERGYTDYPTLH
ncbi:LOW QUALITY PROTEIN: NADH:flavin oxidoreductase [Singulisphaera acidiphila DSM 18658]|uniref:NADH:flavin oxidoreductase n=1 Tax=Singulisphaera acidiphila (strain ATCC BAA-1392 / DSM 18658 / VKM B-2454 / MOB10) TaxID=886293 RepID=L0DIE3_SINAD|nr:LOW QUALITY PROTEIN: NADH:flavin oxidoreductase [Singulisphaera acidiphila DSM 18658]